MARRLDGPIPNELRFARSERWVRVRVGGHLLVDSRRALVVWEPSRVIPQYCFPCEDVDRSLLDADGRPAHDGVRERVWDLRGLGDRGQGAVWSYAERDLDGYLAVRWDAADEWWEEEERLFAHVHDPYHRIDVRHSSRHVRVTIDGTLLAESRRPSLLFETGLPPRYYLPPADVRTELLEPSEHRTACPYKGIASYWSVRLDDVLHRDLVWSYPDPEPEMPKVKGLLCFFNEQVDLEVDGEQVSRPRTQWS
jgi:uncharacterized protein (DUF427 family)